jgi:hypothetical protein
MRPDFRREYQIDWVHAEAERLRAHFGSAITVETHIIGGVFTRGERVLTISDPGGKGIDGAVCLTDRSEEGSLWRAELFPIPQDGQEHVPTTKSIQSVTLQMRYNRCVYATRDRVMGKASGEDGLPDFAPGVSKLLAGMVFLQRRRSLGRGHRAEAYTLASA